MSKEKEKKSRMTFLPIQGARPLQRDIPVKDLIVDLTYQRGVISAEVALIAKKWDWLKYTSIAVAKRPDGKFAVTDGQQRTTAAKLRGDIRSLPALVHGRIGLANEARAFTGPNEERHSMKAVQSFRAHIVEGRAQELEVLETAKEFGFKISDSTSKDGSVIGCVKALLRLRKRGTLRAALGCASAAWPEHPRRGVDYLVTSLGDLHEERTEAGACGMDDPRVIKRLARLDLTTFLPREIENVAAAQRMSKKKACRLRLKALLSRIGLNGQRAQES
jgi:hypothetical protein